MSFFGSIIVFIVLTRANRVVILEGETNENGDDPLEAGQLPRDSGTLEVGAEKWKLLLTVGKVLSLVALCATGALQPSVLSVIYYVVFLGAATWWGCNKELDR